MLSVFPNFRLNLMSQDFFSPVCSSSDRITLCQTKPCGSASPPPLPTGETEGCRPACGRSWRNIGPVCTTGAALLLGLETVFTSHHLSCSLLRFQGNRATPRSKKVYISFLTTSMHLFCPNRARLPAALLISCLRLKNLPCHCSLNCCYYPVPSRAECPSEYHVMPEFQSNCSRGLRVSVASSK